jgi:hypothetical protein
MTPEQKAAYINSQSACALIEAMGMISENQQRVHRGESMAYTESAFTELIDKYGIGPNGVMHTLRD